MKRLVQLSSVAGAMALFFASSPAHAFELGTPAHEHPFRTAQNFALEIRIGPYHPQVDDDPNLNGQRPFAKSFGSVARVYAGLELDWQTFRIPHFGTIGPGLGVGRISMSRNATTVSGRTSGDETSLTIYPFWAVGVLRADFLFREFGLPVVPYGKAGISAGIWRASNSAGTSSEGNVSGKGTSWGTSFSLGVAFALDALDPGASRNMDNATGINATYVFLEGYWLTLDGIAQDRALRVGSNTWAAGLAFEF